MISRIANQLNTMAITLTDLSQHLDGRNWKYKMLADRQVILTGVAGQNVDHIGIAMQLSEDGEFLQFQALDLLPVKDSVFKGVIFQTLLTLNYQTKLVKFEYDPIDGEVRAAIDLPLEDGGLTSQQFERCLTYLITVVDRLAMPRLKEVLATGNDPGQRGRGKMLAESMSPSQIALLREVFEAIQTE